MKKLITVLGIAPVIAFAQPQEQAVIKVKVPCNEWKYVAYNLVKEFGEVPVTSGKAVVETDNVTLAGRIVTFINPESKSFTVLMRIGEGPDSMACVVLAGDKFGPAINPEELDLMNKVKT